MDTAARPAAARTAGASPRCSTTASSVGSACMRSDSWANGGRVGAASQTTFSRRAACTASHSRSAVTPMKSPRRTTLAAMPAMDASSTETTLAPAP